MRSRLNTLAFCCLFPAILAGGGAAVGTTTTTTTTMVNASTGADVSAAEWKALVTAAKPGTTIYLGTRHVIFTRIRGVHDITIKGGEFGPITLDQWQNVTFDSTRFNARTSERTTGPYIDAYTPQGLTFRNTTFIGWVNSTTGALAGYSLNIRGGSNVSVLGSTFRDMANFMTFIRTTNVNVLDNDFTNIREGVRLVGTTNGFILRNRIGPFKPATGDHADCVQFFTAGLTLATDHAAYNSTVTDNLMLSSGAGRSQGIFVRDEANLWQSGRGYNGLTIINNLLIGTGWHGIALGAGATNVTITNNRLWLRVGGDTVTDNWVKLDSDTATSLTTNQAGSFLLTGKYQTSGNIINKTPPSLTQINSLVNAWQTTFRPGKSYPPVT
ncbi:right-handed parallel beta-helix repeat-containing protein [Sphingomonas lycopersici]|uniref:Right-handed parallel beta-helix repeat-containing protein n=1 Tax=Sphingomonas lycopersici TaxID=2951807 RepID=A0AA41ZAP1_9SPHN|nr:right-handed parallel beta-helix repeat-containing protein [Sphingomonas lycopersici]MCW6536560.1 right-handed parallel beta-helix repeat-containing protein [Sphingomonas lycopersici]